MEHIYIFCHFHMGKSSKGLNWSQKQCQIDVLYIYITNLTLCKIHHYIFHARDRLTPSRVISHWSNPQFSSDGYVKIKEAVKFSSWKVNQGVESLLKFH